MRRLTHRPIAWNSLLAVMLLVAHAGCDATIRTATREAKPLAYVGQVQLGEPSSEEGHVIVPLKYVGGQWRQNSAIVPMDVKSTVKDGEIDLTVVTSVATDTNGAQGNHLILPADAKGEYQVYYLDPDGTRHEIGGLKINQ